MTPGAPGAHRPQAPKKSFPWWGVLLAVLGTCVLLAAIVGGGLVWWLRKNKDRLAAEGLAQSEEASRFAESHDQSQCVDEGIRKVTSCRGIACEARARIFTLTCLELARASRAFCNSVPNDDSVLPMTVWSRDECARRGQPNEQRCFRLMPDVARACRESRPSL